MKKVMLLLSAIILAYAVGCVKEAEQPPIEYKYSVEATNEDFSDKGVNETVSLPFSIKTEYDFEKVPMKYKVETDKQGVIKNGDETILPNDVYTMTSPELNLSYEGKEAGEHTIKVTFFNDNTKKATMTKEIKLKYIEYEYTLEALSAKNSVYQGEAADFEYKLTPKDETKKEGYTITFKSYDDQDIKLERTNITFNGQRIEFNKSYPIENLSSFKIQVIPFYAGAKSLKYEIKNKTGKREGDIAIEVKQNVFEVAGNLDKTPIGAAGEIVNFVGTVKKEPLYAKKLKYKTSIIQGTAEGIETNDWKEITYEGNEIKIPVKILKNGQYQYKISFQDEFGNQAEKILPINSKANYRFRVDVEGRTNPIQGEEVTYKLKIVREEPRLNSNYRIILGKEIEGDDIAKRSIITVSGTKIAGKENEYDVQENNSDPLNIEYYTNVKIKSFSAGAKKLKYKIYRYARGEAGETVDGYIEFNVQAAEFRLENGQLDKTQIQNEGEVITYSAKITKGGSSRTLKYKTVVIEGNKSGIKTTNNSDWEDIELPSDNIIKIPINILKEGQYKYQMLFRDEFGNEIGTDILEIGYREKEKFNATFSRSDEKIKLGKPYDSNITIYVENDKTHNPSVEYFISFENTKVKYGDKIYNKGEEILVKTDKKEKSIDFNFSIISDESNFNERGFYSYFKVYIRNSDGASKNMNVWAENFRYLKINGMYLKFSFFSYTHYSQHGNGYYHFKEVLNAAVNREGDVIDSTVNEEDVKIKFYLLSTKGKGMDDVTGRKNIDEDVEKNFYTYKSFVIDKTTKTVYDSGDLGWVRHNEGDDAVKAKRQHEGNVRIEVFYKDKKIYEASASNIELNHDELVPYVKFTNGRVYYQNYD